MIENILRQRVRRLDGKAQNLAKLW